MTQKLKVGAVSYLNTRPLIYGFEQGRMKEEMDLVFDYPAKIASFLINDQVDIGLVPVAVIPDLAEYHIISDYCIGCNGEVASVCLFSDVPLHEIKTIVLDYQSKTSVALLKILLQEHWKISPKLVAGEKNYENSIAGSTAGLVIGDRALQQRIKSPYIYDLGTAWKEMTGLPFVFAAWVSNKKIDPAFITDFNRAIELGLQSIDIIVQEQNGCMYDLHQYYTQNISYPLDENKKAAMKLFINKINASRKLMQQPV
ncbi:MAG: menaquinone biosynthesis protein [Chitinophagaceae bacterium]|nr:menaquinone biosynthesis protein [Chitinophagaceae bacterium]